MWGLGLWGLSGYWAGELLPTYRAAEGQWPRQRAWAEDLAPVGRQTHVVACGEEGVRLAKPVPVGPCVPGHRNGYVSMRRAQLLGQLGVVLTCHFD